MPPTLLSIVLIGPESSGKTTLTERLALHYHTSWASESSRAYYEARLKHFGKLTYHPDDAKEITALQLREEKSAETNSNRVYFIDAGIFSTLVYQAHYFNSTPDYLRQLVENSRYNAYLLLRPDIAWKKDPLRNREHRRGELFALFELKLKEFGFSYEVIGGDSETRFSKACTFVDKLLQN